MLPDASKPRILAAMQSVSEIRALLEARGLRPKHRFGQNFLIDKNLLWKLIEAAGIEAGDVVLEVGPGTGTLTRALLEAGAEVIASEIDRDLGALLEEQLGDRMTLIIGDCLGRGRTLAPEIVEALGGRSFKLVSNLPYQVASPLMTGLLLDHPSCLRQAVTIQKEVADRLLAPPGGKAYGPLGIIVQALGEVRRIATVKPSNFWPMPQVTSAMIVITPRVDHGIGDAHGFARFVTMLFSKRRKQLGAIFGRERAWPLGVRSDQRPEVLRGDQIVALWISVRGEL